MKAYTDEFLVDWLQDNPVITKWHRDRGYIVVRGGFDVSGPTLRDALTSLIDQMAARTAEFNKSEHSRLIPD